MTRGKKILLIAGLAVAAVAALAIYYVMQTWPLRFGRELDAFFGEGAWRWTSSDLKESRMYTVYRTSGTTGLSGERPGTFREWDILYTAPDGEQTIWTLSDHTMRINHDKHWILSPDRYSARQALTLELMDVSFEVAQQGVYEQVLLQCLPQQEADCLTVDLSYRGGNPPPELYDELARQPWFTADKVSAQAYLSSDLYDFYLWIRVYDYRFEQLPEEEQQHLLQSLPALEQCLRETYGQHADYEIYLGEGHEAQYDAAAS